MTHSTAAKLRRHAAPLEPFEHRHQRDGDDQGGGHRQEEFGAGAKRERQGEDEADAADQRQRGEQPHALELERFMLLLVRITVWRDSGPVHGGDLITAARARQRLLAIQVGRRVGPPKVHAVGQSP